MKTKSTLDKIRSWKTWGKILTRLLEGLDAGTLTATKRRVSTPEMGYVDIYSLQKDGRDIIALTPGFKRCDGYTKDLDALQVHEGPYKISYSNIDRKKADVILPLFAVISGLKSGEVMFWPVSDKCARSIITPTKETWSRIIQGHLAHLGQHLDMQQRYQFTTLTFIKDQAKLAGVSVHFEKTDLEAAREKAKTLLLKRVWKLHCGLPPLSRALLEIEQATTDAGALDSLGVSDDIRWLENRMKRLPCETLYNDVKRIASRNVGRSEWSPYLLKDKHDLFSDIFENIQGTIHIDEILIAFQKAMEVVDVHQRIRKVSGNNLRQNSYALPIAIQAFREKYKGDNQ